MQTALTQQITIHNRLKHPNIVQFIQVLQTNNNIYIIQEYCQNGNLRELLNNNKLLNNHNKLSQSDALHCIKCLCMGFTIIAKNGVIHRDLKPENVLIKQNQLKIADFGFAKQLLNHRQLTKTALGSPFYMAPQLLKGQKYSSKCDIWSIGVIYYQLLYGTVPWKCNNLYQLIQNIQQNGLVFPQDVNISEQSQLFLIETLQIKQSQRLSWLQVFQHKIWELLPYQQDNNKDSHVSMSNFKDISMNWRNSYIRSAQKLNGLAPKVEIQQLIYVFLQLSVSSLSFDQFKKVILWLLNEQGSTTEVQKDVGTMYELFDKDCNGVIDIQEFIVSFGFGDGYKQMVKVIQKLLDNGIFYDKMKDHEVFSSQAVKYGFELQLIQHAYMLIKSIQI